MLSHQDTRRPRLHGTAAPLAIVLSCVLSAGCGAVEEIVSPPADTHCLDGTFQASIPHPLQIPDDSDRGVVSTLAVVGNGAIASLSLSAEVSHRFPRDLVVTLTSPAGTEVTVSDPDHPKIENARIAITAMQGEPAAGTWTLSVFDVVPEDAGTLDAWSITIGARCSLAAR